MNENLGPMLLPTRSLGVLALVLFVLFAAVLAGALWPFQPLDPLWQLRLSAALINAALLPLLGLALLQLATFLDPEDPLLERRRRQQRRAEPAAPDPAGPGARPPDLAKPLPLLKAQVRAVLQQAEQQIERERQQPAPVSPWRFLPDLLRNTVAFLALAIGFAALTRRPGQPISLLQDGSSAASDASSSGGGAMKRQPSERTTCAS
jgi:hypothetical protein